jgi:O-methyltransferase involved in polyketide biosynthesis
MIHARGQERSSVQRCRDSGAAWRGQAAVAWFEGPGAEGVLSEKVKELARRAIVIRHRFFDDFVLQSLGPARSTGDQSDVLLTAWT